MISRNGRLIGSGRNPAFQIAAGVLVVLSGGLVENRAAAQVRESQPRIILNSEGSTGQVWKLAFSPDSKALYAAGADKAVHVWHVREENDKLRASHVKTFRWEIARGYRGAIYAMDVFGPRGQPAEIVAVGGSSARSGFDLVHFDAGTGEVLRSLPAADPYRDRKTFRPGHLASVVNVTFSPDGLRMASADMSGEILVWSAPKWTYGTKRNPEQDQVQVRPPIDRMNETIQPVVFIDANTLAVPDIPPLAGRPSLFLYDVRTGARSPLAKAPASPVSALARDLDGLRWASAHRDGSIQLWSGVNSGQGPIEIKNARNGLRVGLSMGFGPGNRLAVGNKFDANRQSVVEVWNLKTRSMEGQRWISDISHQPSVAFSPNGKWLALHCPERHEVAVHLVPAAGTPLDFKEPQALTLRGRGRLIRHVTFDTEARRLLGVSSEKDDEVDQQNIGEKGKKEKPPERAFDLLNARYFPAAPENIGGQPIKWRSRGDNSGGWKATLGASRAPGQLHVTLANGAVTSSLVFDRGGQGIPTGAFCWIPDARGQPVAVAIGTKEQNGIFVYSLPGAGGKAVLLRYFRDHTGAVQSLTSTSDGKFLASASEDETVKVWSLAGLSEDRFEAGWGAAITAVDDGVRVVRVTPGSIAARRGLKVNDVLTEMSRLDAAPAQGRDMEAALRGQRLYEEVSSLILSRPGENGPVEIQRMVPGWEPMATLFFDRGGDWAVWTPEGYYEASPALGDDLFGWQFNRGVGSTPRIVTAGNLRRELERPDLIRGLFTVGHVEGAFQALGQAMPVGNAVDIAERSLPEVRIVEPRLLAEAGETLKAEVRFPRGTKDLFREPRATLQGISLGQVAMVNQSKEVRLCEWKNTLPRTPLGRLRVTLEGTDETESRRLFADAEVAVKANVPPPRQFNVHFVAFAASAYFEKKYPNLLCPESDAEAMEKVLQRTQGNHFLLANPTFKSLNRQFHAGEVAGNLAKVKKVVRPDDLLIVFIAGHGAVIDGHYCLIAPGEEGKPQPPIRWSEIAALGSESVPCRKLFLIDTCHSGDAFRDTPEMKAVFQQLSECVVVTATQPGQVAYEGDQWGNHGAFTYALLGGLAGAADADKDGDVTIGEILAHAVEEVPATTFRRQRPQHNASRRAEALLNQKLTRRP
ncbi:MAG: caspase family protein [Planctomycetaceae bacterium]|nr:caspase family protein [Planctomycetaceae bacterium]